MKKTELTPKKPKLYKKKTKFIPKNPRPILTKLKIEKNHFEFEKC